VGLRQLGLGLCPPAVPYSLDKGDYVSVRRSYLVLRPAKPENQNEVHKLTREAADWLRRYRDTDQWSKPWPGRDRRMRNDLLRGKTWLVWDDTTAAGTITIDPEEPTDAYGRPVWPTHKRHELALYVRRVIVSRSYAGIGLGARLLDWAADVAMRDYGAALIRVDVWTTNRKLHAYYRTQRFTRVEGRDPRELADYPSQALFEREANQARSDYTKLLIEEDGRASGSLASEAAAGTSGD
jgi:GNAT superfamily N-acetyltransferase